VDLFVVVEEKSAG